MAPWREAVKSTSDTRKVPWLLRDKSQPTPEMDSPEYARVVLARSKETLKKLHEDGKMNGDHDEVEYY